MDTEEAHRSLVEYLRLIGNQEDLEEIPVMGAANIKFYGISRPILRLLMTKWLESHKPDLDEKKKIVQRLWQGSSREERLIALWMIAEEDELINSVTGNEILTWSGEVDDWEVADTLAVLILGAWILRNPSRRFLYLEILVNDENYWRRSIAVSSTVALNTTKSDLSFPHETIEILKRVLGDRHPMVIKAVSWALQELGRKHRHMVESFLEIYLEQVDSGVVREVMRRLD